MYILPIKIKGHIITEEDLRTVLKRLRISRSVHYCKKKLKIKKKTLLLKSGRVYRRMMILYGRSVWR